MENEKKKKAGLNYRALILVVLLLVAAILALAMWINIWLFVLALVGVVAAVVGFMLHLGIIGCIGPFANAGMTISSNRMKKKYGARPKGEIIFYGASNFTFWKTSDNDMKPYVTQNHGFGGSTDDLMRDNASRMLYPYKPSIVFIQTGSNDNARGLQLEQIKQNKIALFAEYRKNLPYTRFIIMSGLPVPARPQFWPDIQAVNQFLQSYCDSQENMEFIDATAVMTKPDGDFRPEYFVKDGLHLNQEGHNAWTVLMKQKLKEMGVKP
ncbi:GDSL-type esterase/lipase family protein [Ruminococcaceae bacterium OttesenSCG-928-D13]|nr:GDSL-type esterase/lipase family protein [Ruminococcaceae bacterium OttesenSCG-928-D13]